jgi:hypothetical protein
VLLHGCPIRGLLRPHSSPGGSPAAAGLRAWVCEAGSIGSVARGVSSCGEGRSESAQARAVTNNFRMPQTSQSPLDPPPCMNANMPACASGWAAARSKRWATA